MPVVIGVVTDKSGAIHFWRYFLLARFPVLRGVQRRLQMVLDSIQDANGNQTTLSYQNLDIPTNSFICLKFHIMPTPTIPGWANQLPRFNLEPSLVRNVPVSCLSGQKITTAICCRHLVFCNSQPSAALCAALHSLAQHRTFLAFFRSRIRHRRQFVLAGHDFQTTRRR